MRNGLNFWRALAVWLLLGMGGLSSSVAEAVDVDVNVNFNPTAINPLVFNTGARGRPAYQCGLMTCTDTQRARMIAMEAGHWSIAYNGHNHPTAYGVRLVNRTKAVVFNAGVLPNGSNAMLNVTINSVGGTLERNESDFLSTVSTGCTVSAVGNTAGRVYFLWNFGQGVNQCTSDNLPAGNRYGLLSPFLEYQVAHANLDDLPAGTYRGRVSFLLTQEGAGGDIIFTTPGYRTHSHRQFDLYVILTVQRDLVVQVENTNVNLEREDDGTLFGRVPLALASNAPFSIRLGACTAITGQAGNQYTQNCPLVRTGDNSHHAPFTVSASIPGYNNGTLTRVRRDQATRFDYTGTAAFQRAVNNAELQFQVDSNTRAAMAAGEYRGAVTVTFDTNL